MNEKDETSKKCEICGEPGSQFILMGEKGRNIAVFYWICDHCEKAIRFVFEKSGELTGNGE